MGQLTVRYKSDLVPNCSLPLALRVTVCTAWTVALVPAPCFLSKRRATNPWRITRL